MQGSSTRAAVIPLLAVDRRDLARPVEERTSAWIRGAYARLEEHFVEELDRRANPIGAKGGGELGITGAAAAVAKPIHNACGVRVRDFPITCEKLLAGLPEP